ncbi:hypothetical protein CK507_17510 [Pseudomonas sp. WN033]|nr:hypothetical protein CK507_17510 [Pseudomonas sp. WN033]
MELGNHRVVTGETLGRIAARYNTSIDQLLRLNPFIRNADHIQAGWNLSVPVSESGSDALMEDEARETPPGAAQNHGAEQNSDSVSGLGEEPMVPQSCSAPSEEVPPVCSSTYATVIYATKEQKFWLLPEQTSEAVQEAIAELASKISPDKSAQERKRGLDELGLLEYFMEPKLTNFLRGEDLERALAIEAEIPDIANRNRAWQRIARENNLPVHPFNRPPMRSPFTAEGRAANRELEATLMRVRQASAALDQLHNEWALLEAKGFAQAKAEGYSYENGMLFSQEAMEARRRVQTYLDKRRQVMSEGQLPDYDLEDLVNTVARGKALRQQVENCTRQCRGRLRGYSRWLNASRGKLKFLDYVDSIIKVADYGLALPEFALIPASEDEAEVHGGVQIYRQYLDAQLKQQQLNQRLQAKYRTWVESTGTNMQPPAGLVAAERQEWDDLQALRNSLKQQAEANVVNGTPKRHLLWNPEQFQPQPVDRLVRAGFPLSEMSLPEQIGSPVRAISLFNLEGISDHLKQSFSNNVVDAMGQEARRIPIDNGGSLSSDKTLFELWLEAQGALGIEDQEADWFDEDGWFDIEKFHVYLKEKNLQVALLDSEAVRGEWGNRLKQVVFRKDIRNDMRLFDPSPQAQLVRCLTPPQSNLHAGASTQGPSFSVAEGLQASAQATLGIDLALGEVEIFSLDIPQRSQASDLIVHYNSYQGEQQTMSLGRYSMHLSARAWGYAGASLLLAAKIELTPNGDLWGKPALTPEQPTTRRAASYRRERRSAPVASGRAANLHIQDGAQASFNLFAGVQAGILLTGALNWAPPTGRAAIRVIPGGHVGSIETSDANQWLSMAELTLGVAAAAGGGLKAEAGLSLHNGRLILKLKASAVAGLGVSGEFSFALSYQGIVEIIHLYRRELHRNHGRRPDWVDEDAGDLMGKINALSAIGLNAVMLVTMELDVIMSLYEALTRPGRAGPVALSIKTYRDQPELQAWFVEATPAALGPMLLTLTSTPRAFTAEISADGAMLGIPQQGGRFTSEQSNLWQQEAIEKILRWILEAAQGAPENMENARHQFGQACLRMNQYGVEEENLAQAYRRNRRRLDAFMAKPVMSDDMDNNFMRAEYRSHIQQLAAAYDELYEYRRPTPKELGNSRFWNEGFRAL